MREEGGMKETKKEREEGGTRGEKRRMEGKMNEAQACH